jgi:hypothetical protein
MVWRRKSTASQSDVEGTLIRRIVEEGSPNADQFRARPMCRAAQRYGEDSLSAAIIGGILQEGSVVALSLGDYTPRGKPSVTLECAGEVLKRGKPRTFLYINALAARLLAANAAHQQVPVGH